MKKIFRSILESDFKLWGVFFLYPAVAALFVQLILLPVFFPQWHAGEGMLAGGDLINSTNGRFLWLRKFMRRAGALGNYTLIGQAPAASRPYFMSCFSRIPGCLIPLYAGLHATAAFILFKIILRLTKNRVISLMAVLTFWLYPSAMIWYTQIHKDGYMIAGALLILLAWLRLGDADTWKRWQNILISLIFDVCGSTFSLDCASLQHANDAGDIAGDCLAGKFFICTPFLEAGMAPLANADGGGDRMGFFGCSFPVYGRWS